MKESSMLRSTAQRFFAILAVIPALLPLPALAASKADVETQFQTWVQSDLWPEAKANVSESTLRVEMPSAAAIGRFCVTARTWRPNRVR